MKKLIVWLDDLRDPSNYGLPDALWLKNSSVFMEFINDKGKLYRRVSEWHFDNDLGLESDQDGYDVFVRLEELLIFGKPCFGNPVIFVHTSNPAAAQKFMLAEESMLRYGVNMVRVNY